MTEAASATAPAWPPGSRWLRIGSAAVLIPGIAGLVAAAVLIGCGVGVITPIGFAHLATTTPTERLGQTLGAAEVGRELGDAGGPLLVGALAAAITLNPAMLFWPHSSPPPPPSSPHPPQSGHNKLGRAVELQSTALCCNGQRRRWPE